MTTSERTVAAALAITFDDRSMRRALLLRDPGALERAHLALDFLDRRVRRDVRFAEGT